MKFNLWRQMRLIGGLIVIAGAFVQPRLVITLFGLVFTAIGTVNGLSALESRVEQLEKGLFDAKN